MGKQPDWPAERVVQCTLQISEDMNQQINTWRGKHGLDRVDGVRLLLAYALEMADEVNLGEK